MIELWFRKENIRNFKLGLQNIQTAVATSCCMSNPQILHMEDT